MDCRDGRYGIGPGANLQPRRAEGGEAQLQRTIVDTRRCSTLTAVAEETKGGKSRTSASGVRLKVDSGKVSKIETVIARTGDFAFKPQGVLCARHQRSGLDHVDAGGAAPHAGVP